VFIQALLHVKSGRRDIQTAALTAGFVFVLGQMPYRQRVHRENYGRLDAWRWAEYDRVVYLDADCMVVGNLEPMFRMPRGLVGTVGALLTATESFSGSAGTRAEPNLLVGCVLEQAVHDNAL